MLTRRVCSRSSFLLGLLIIITLTLNVVPAWAWTTTEIISPDPEMFGAFACAADFAGNRLLVGEFYGNLSGRVYEFIYSDEQWSFSQQITPLPGQIEGEFGGDVAIDGDWAIIGACGESEIASHDGAVYFFQHDGSEWQQMQRIPNPCAVPDSGANFGYRVAIDDTLALVTARYSDVGDTLSGAAYLYALQGTEWTLRGRLIPEDEHAWLELGSSAALSGKKCVVGAIGDNMQIGSVYVFEWQGDTIQQIQKIIPEGCSMGAWFGGALDYDGETIIIGAWADSQTQPFGGAAYLYEFEPDSTEPYQFVQRIVSSDLAEMDWFSSDVSVHNGHVLVGAPWDDDNGDVSGSVYLFDRNNEGVWLESEKMTLEGGQVGDHFGMCTVSDSIADFTGSMIMAAEEIMGAGYGLVIMPETNSTGWEKSPTVPEGYTMTSWPNPFNARARVTITLPNPGDIRLELFDILGRKTGQLYAGEVNAGNHTFDLDADKLTSGVYFLRLAVAEKQALCQRVYVMK